MAISKLVAGAKGAEGNSTGAEIAETVNGLIELGNIKGLYNTYVKVEADRVLVGKKLGGKDFFWSFEQRGVNSAFSCNRAYTFDNASDEVSFDHDFDNASEYIGNIDTDWIGPYFCKLQTEPTNYTFVGGHHDKDGGTNPNGTPSSRSSGYEIFIDGEKVTGVGEYVCMAVTLTTSNYVQTNNPASTQEILRQDVSFKVNEFGIYVDIDTVALDDIRVDRFYGIQCYALNGFNEVRFVGDESVTGSVVPSETSEPDSSSEVRVIAHHLDDGNVMTSFVENGGIGDYRFKGVRPSASRSNAKSYFNCIYQNTNMSTGDVLSLSGGYSVTEASQKTGSPKGLYIKPSLYGFDVISDFYGDTSASSMSIDLIDSYKAKTVNSIIPSGCSLTSLINGNFRSVSDNSTPSAVSFAEFNK